MPTLSYAPHTCALATLIDAHAAYELRRIDFAASQQNSSGYLAINPEGRAPALT